MINAMKAMKAPGAERKSAEELTPIDVAELRVAGFRNQAELDEAHAKEGLHEYGETKREFLERKYCQSRPVAAPRSAFSTIRSLK